MCLPEQLDPEIQLSKFSASNAGDRQNHTRVPRSNAETRMVFPSEEYTGVYLSHGQSKTVFVIRSGNREKVSKLLESNADPDIENRSGWRALHYAADNDQLTIVQMLLQFSADTAVKTKGGRTPLHRAAAMPPPAGGGKAAGAGPGALIVEMLVSAQADVNALNVYGESALHLAARAGK